MRLLVIGAGPGKQELLTREAENAIRQADSLYATDRLYDLFSPLNPNTRRVELRDLCEAVAGDKGETIGVLCSGDVGFYSVSSMLEKAFPQADIRWYNGLSSMPDPLRQAAHLLS